MSGLFDKISLPAADTRLLVERFASNSGTNAAVASHGAA
jgi:hypothetical protein